MACRVLPNNTVVCDDHVYQNFHTWKDQKNQLDKLIQEYRERLDKLKVCLKVINIYKFGVQTLCRLCEVI